MGGKLRVSADAVAPDERFGFWREISLKSAGLTVEWDRRDGRPFRAEAVAETKGPLRRIRGSSDASISRRGPREIADHPTDGVIIYRDLSEATLLERNRKTFVMGRGSLIALDFDAPSATHRIDSFKYDLLILPTALLRPHLTKRDRPLGHLFARTPGAESLATTYIESLLKEWDDIQEPAMGAMADALGRLIGVAFGAPVEEHADAVTAGRLAEIDAYIERHFADPALSAASCAAALRISERAVYAAFERRAESFAARVRRRRLEECRAALAAEPHRSVLDIAYAWGFGSLASFYRAFQAAFGASPGDLRKAARAK